MPKLTDVLLCAECDELVPTNESVCPSCTCTQFIVLSSIVRPMQLRAEIDTVRKQTVPFTGFRSLSV
jgi:hypothetical protein